MNAYSVFSVLTELESVAGSAGLEAAYTLLCCRLFGGSWAADYSQLETAFSWVDSQGRSWSVRCQFRGKRRYWYAYRRFCGLVRSVYLGVGSRRPRLEKLNDVS